MALDVHIHKFSTIITQAWSLHNILILRSVLDLCYTEGNLGYAVASSIPGEVIGIFHHLNPSGHTRALRSMHPLTEMITKDLPWGVKVASA
jgi:hypothetical protein